MLACALPASQDRTNSDVDVVAQNLIELAAKLSAG